MTVSRTQRFARSAVKSLFRSVGLDVIRRRGESGAALAGLRRLAIRSVIDCGANEGQFARDISRVFPQVALYCFEPLPQPFAALSAWAESQRGRATCFQAALGERDEEVSMHLHTEHSTSSSLLATTTMEESLFPETRAQAEIAVRVTTLDAALAAAIPSMKHEILLKLDVQGYEDRVLRGATRILPSVRACLLEVCVDPLYVEQAAFKDIVAILAQFDLTYAGNADQVFGEDGRIMWLDALFLRR